MRWCKVDLRTVALWCASNNTAAIETTGASVSVRRTRVVRIVGAAPQHLFFSLVVSFSICFHLCGVRCVDISKWPQSSLTLMTAVKGTLRILPLGNGGIAEPYRVCGTCNVGAGPLRLRVVKGSAHAFDD